jgi:hypothetical protein
LKKTKREVGVMVDVRFEVIPGKELEVGSLSYGAKKTLASRLGTTVDKLVKEFYSESFAEKRFPVMLLDGQVFSVIGEEVLQDEKRKEELVNGVQRLVDTGARIERGGVVVSRRESLGEVFPSDVFEVMIEVGVVPKYPVPSLFRTEGLYRLVCENGAVVPHDANVRWSESLNEKSLERYLSFKPKVWMGVEVVKKVLGELKEAAVSASVYVASYRFVKKWEGVMGREGEWSGVFLAGMLRIRNRYKLLYGEALDISEKPEKIVSVLDAHPKMWKRLAVDPEANLYDVWNQLTDCVSRLYERGLVDYSQRRVLDIDVSRIVFNREKGEVVPELRVMQ